MTISKNQQMRGINAKGKGGGETINLEKQFVKGLQNLGGKNVNWRMDGFFMRFLFSDLTSQDNKLTRGLSVRYDPVKIFKSSTRQSKLSFEIDQTYNISTDISTTPATLTNAIIPSS